jgi:hypothetical protein
MMSVLVVHDEHRRTENAELLAGCPVLPDVVQVKHYPISPGEGLDPGEEMRVVRALVVEVEELQVA